MRRRTTARRALLGQQDVGAQTHPSIRSLSHRVERVLQEVVDDLSQLRDVTHDAGQISAQLRRRRPLSRALP